MNMWLHAGVDWMELRIFHLSTYFFNFKDALNL